jgi:uncharacterized protein (TIGR03790 family)
MPTRTASPSAPVTASAATPPRPFGGDLLDSASHTDQMSSLRWLEAGATASYGTVSEPCNYWQKFPNPSVLFKNYVQGNSAIEAYWKSVAWPAQDAS